MWTALLPLMWPTTCDTAYFGGIEIIMCTWSGIRWPSSIRLSFCAAKRRRTSPRYGRSWPNRAFRRPFGMNTPWYLHSHREWLRHRFQNRLRRFAITKIQAAVRSARITRPSLSWRRSSRLVGEQPRAVMLDHAADGAEPGAVRRADLPDAGLNALAQAEVAVRRAVVARVGVQPADSGADDLGQAQQVREEAAVVDVRGRGYGGQRDPVGRGYHVGLGAGLAPVGRVGAGQLAAVLGADRAAVDHHVPGRGLGSRSHHPDQGDVRSEERRVGKEWRW